MRSTRDDDGIGGGGGGGDNDSEHVSINTDPPYFRSQGSVDCRWSAPFGVPKFSTFRARFAVVGGIIDIPLPPVVLIERFPELPPPRGERAVDDKGEDEGLLKYESRRLRSCDKSMNSRKYLRIFSTAGPDEAFTVGIIFLRAERNKNKNISRKDQDQGKYHAHSA